MAGYPPYHQPLLTTTSRFSTIEHGLETDRLLAFTSATENNQSGCIDDSCITRSGDETLTSSCGLTSREATSRVIDARHDHFLANDDAMLSLHRQGTDRRYRRRSQENTVGDATPSVTALTQGRSRR